MEFILGKPVELEESLTCEFKEPRGSDPISFIGKTVDEYVVAYLNTTGCSLFWGIRDEDRVVVGVELDSKKRDRLRQVVGQKLAAIAPPVQPQAITLPLHNVLKSGEPESIVLDTYVVECKVASATKKNFYLTGSGEAYKKTIGGKVKLSGSELLGSLLTQLEYKQEEIKSVAPPDWGPLSYLAPSILRRANLISPILDGCRILWVDDNPGHTIFERTAFSTLNISVDVATSSGDARFMMDSLRPDLIVSDISRGVNPRAGIDFLEELRRDDVDIPLVFYIQRLDRTKPIPRGSFGITNFPGELFHLVFDVLARIKT